MNILTAALQLVGLAVLIPAVAIGTLRFDHRDDDGPSILFPGGELVSGELHTGKEPDWGFTWDVSTVELQLEDKSSRLIWIHESEGKIYIASGYMNSVLGRLWKHWAVLADEGSGLAVLRINGKRYERQLVRINEGPSLEGFSAVSKKKYNSPSSRASIEAGDTWVFELAPRGI